MFGCFDDIEYKGNMDYMRMVNKLLKLHINIVEAMLPTISLANVNAGNAVPDERRLARVTELTIDILDYDETSMELIHRSKNLVKSFGLRDLIDLITTGRVSGQRVGTVVCELQGPEPQQVESWLAIKAVQIGLLDLLVQVLSKMKPIEPHILNSAPILDYWLLLADNMRLLQSVLPPNYEFITAMQSADQSAEQSAEAHQAEASPMAHQGPDAMVPCTKRQRSFFHPFWFWHFFPSP